MKGEEKMNEEIRKYVNELFEEAPNTKRANDLKDEIISNANEKYQDFIREGKTKEDAMEKVKEEIGSVEELIQELQKSNPMDSNKNYEERKKTALVVSISVGLYILSLITCIIADELGLPDFISAVSLFTIAGIATCLLIYHFMSKPKYNKYEDTMVEEFKEWKGKNDSKKEIRKAISSIVWSITVIVYLIISFTFGIWYISWVIFIIASLVENIINLIFKLGERG